MQQFTSFTAHIKEYATEIEILDPPAGIRPGMTAQAAVVIEERETATQVPLQAVFERDGHYFCLLHNATTGLEARQVQLGPTNDKFVVVETGLSGGEQVVVTPRLFADRVSMPVPANFPPRLIARRSPPGEETEGTAVAQSESPKRTVRRKVPLDGVLSAEVEPNSPTAAAAGL